MASPTMDDMKLVVKELNERLNKKLNVISYDNLRGEQRVELLLAVFKEIDKTINLESFEVADPEDVVARVLEMLRVYKYQPPIAIDSSTFRQGLIVGDKAILTHVLSHLLSRLDDLKKRAYLARFLVKLEVSPEVEGDNDIVLLYQQYEQQIDTFKQVHTRREGLKKSTRSVVEVQKDIKDMEEEKEQVEQKLSNVKRKVDTSSNGPLFQMVVTFRDEKEKNQKMGQQNGQLTGELKQLAQRMARLSNQLKEAQLMYQSGSTPSDMLDKLSVEIEVKRQLAKEVLPKELESVQRYVQDLQEVEAQPTVGPDLLEKINGRIGTINREINTVVEKKMLREDSTDDKLALFKQNAASVTKKRESVRLSVIESEQKLTIIRDELEDKKAAFDGQEILKGDALKAYVTSIRNKGNTYKKKQTELGELRNELGIQNRTLEQLVVKEKHVLELLVEAEEKRGISGYFSMQETTRKASSAAQSAPTSVSISQYKGQVGQEMSVEGISGSIKKLNGDIADKKTQLAPVIKDLRPLRQQSQDLQSEYDQKKATYDATAAGLESALGKLEVEVKKLDTEVNKQETAEFRAKCDLQILSSYESMLSEESKCVVSTSDDHPDDHDKSSSIKAKLQKELSSELELSEELKSKQKHLKENEALTKRQVKLWKDLQILFAVKKKGHQRLVEAKTTRNELQKQDYLVL